MQTIYLPLSQPVSVQKPIVLALGFFDGVHLGHCEVIHEAKRKAAEENHLSAVMSFFPHPKSVLSDGAQSIDYLMPLYEKEKYVKSLGIDIFIVVQFDRDFASLLPEQFVEQYLVKLGVTHVVAGFDYSYGKKGKGHLGRLTDDSGGLITVTEIGKVEYTEGKISSTCIREKIRLGKVDEMPSLLGRYYEVQGIWHEDSIQINAYYLLPAKGKYEAVVCCKHYSVVIELYISDEADAVYVCRTDRNQIPCGESVAIVWKRMISKEPLRGGRLKTIAY